MRFLLLLAIAAGVLSSCMITGNIASSIPSEPYFNYSVLFCDGSVYCLDELLRYINSSYSEVKCALYSFDESVLSAFEAKSASASVAVVADSGSKLNSSILFKRDSKGLMHDKFCVFDRSIVWTGSFNPTGRKNVLDNVVIINSTLLANNYLKEFHELEGNSSSKTTTVKVMLNTTLIESYFCPEDNCINVLQSRLAEAESSIYFAAYSFTHPKIANELVIKSSGGVAVMGVIEKGSEYSQLPLLKSNSIAVEDAGKGLLHHKFFIIDNKTVITGSFNPTRNGDERNDENMLAIHNEKIAGAYLAYFEMLLNINKKKKP